MSKEKSFPEMLGEVSALTKAPKDVADILAALSPPATTPTAAGAVTLAKAPASESGVAKAIFPFLPGAVGAAVGAFAWRKHRVLGGVAGLVAGSTALPIIRGSSVERKRAFCMLGIDGAAIAGALLAGEDHRVRGFALGFMLGAIATAFVPGSPTNDIWHWVLDKLDQKRRPPAVVETKTTAK